MTSNQLWHELGVAEGYSKALLDLVKSLEEIDSCEYASFSLGLIREKTVELLEKKKEEMKNES